MTHTKADVIENTQMAISALDKQIALYRDAASALGRAITECENAKRAIVLVSNGVEQVPAMAEVARGGFIKNLSEKIAAAGNGT